ncbi:MAG: hypothetical protein ACREBJ_10310 [Nitrosotalea sp.]
MKIISVRIYLSQHHGKDIPLIEIEYTGGYITMYRLNKKDDEVKNALKWLNEL